jgi:hypothetical protein
VCDVGNRKMEEFVNVEMKIVMCVGTIDEIVLEAVISPRHHAEGFVKDKEFINGLGGEYSLKLREHLKVSESDMVQLKNTQNSGYVQELEFACFPPGSVIAMRYGCMSLTCTPRLALGTR